MKTQHVYSTFAFPPDMWTRIEISFRSHIGWDVVKHAEILSWCRNWYVNEADLCKIDHLNTLQICHNCYLNRSTYLRRCKTLPPGTQKKLTHFSDQFVFHWTCSEVIAASQLVPLNETVELNTSQRGYNWYLN